MTFDPAARGGFEVMSGGLKRLAYRASITLGEERAEPRPVWDQVVQQAANWPGPRLRAALRRQDKGLAELESQMESSDPGI